MAKDELYADFDAFMAELEDRAPQIRVFGEVVVLPPDIGLKRIIEAVRQLDGRGDDEQVSEDDLIQAAAPFYGEERVRRWYEEHGLGIRGLRWLIEKAKAALELDEGQEAEEGEAPAPEGAKPTSARSSRTGRSSRRTSSGSTTSSSSGSTPR
jgi:Mg-chelatase subunit ChlI